MTGFRRGIRPGRGGASEQGATSVEYAILAGFIAAVAAAAFLGLGVVVFDFFDLGGKAFP